MASITKRVSNDGSTTYRVRVRLKGKPLLTATFDKITDARKWARITEGTALEGRHFPSSEAKRRTVAEAIDRYIAESLPQKRPSTVYNQRYQLRYWRAQLGHLLLADLTPAVIAEYRTTLAKDRSGSTVNRWIAVLSNMLAQAAKEWQWLDENPCHAVAKLREPPGRVRFLTLEELERLLSACKTSRNPCLHLVVVLALSTGARRGELLSLTWPVVDLEQGTITLYETKNDECGVCPAFM